MVAGGGGVFVLEEEVFGKKKKKRAQLKFVNVFILILTFEQDTNF